MKKQLPKFANKLCDLFEYNFTMNDIFIKSHLENLGLITERLSTLLDHIINAHQICNSRILVKEPFNRFQINSPLALQTLNLMNYQNSISIIKEKDLEEVISYQIFTGELVHNSIEDILFHAINHSTYHRGQIANDLKKIGIYPPASDYILYKRGLSNINLSNIV